MTIENERTEQNCEMKLLRDGGAEDGAALGGARRGGFTARGEAQDRKG